MKKQTKVDFTPLNVQQKAEVYYKLFHRAFAEWEKARRTNFFLFLIGMLFGCAGTLIGIGLGKYLGGL